MSDNQAIVTENAEEAIEEKLQFLVFHAASGTFGIDILQTNEILKPVPITRLPNVEPEILGVINLRGNILPVMDLNKKFAENYTPLSRSSRIVVTNADGKFMGLLVDRISGVVHLTASELEASEVGNLSRDYIKGAGRSEGKLFLIIDNAKLQNSVESAGRGDL